MRAKVLVAGIGNIFLGDDAFGSEAARRLLRREWPADVRVEDFGIRGFDLTFALLDGYETIVMVDATPRGGAPGTLYCIEADVSQVPQAGVEPHGMNPLRVLATARSMGARYQKAYVVGCEPDPQSVDPDGPGSMGLSPAAEASLDEAVRMVEELVGRALEGRSFTEGA
jgi:hydrogenase maturation protease